MPVHIQTFFDVDTATFTHVVTDRTTQSAVIIDPVLGYDPYSGRTNTVSADKVVGYITEHGLRVEWILETHIHADHITAAHYLKKEVGGNIGVGAIITEVLDFWVPIFNTAHDTPLDGSQFDYIFHNKEVIKFGNVSIHVLHTPGHTPACVSYCIEDAIFVGDTLFMPDVGTARTDFPGGSAETLYDSIQKILSFPDDTRLFMCHDYPPDGREIAWISTVQQQKAKNIMVRDGISKEEYVSMRHQRDKGKAVPRLLLPSIQSNLRAGTFGDLEANNVQYVKIPINTI